jgi:hypothetical protein
VVWYSGQFYALFFLTSIAKVDAKTANLLIAASLVIGTPFFIFFGALSDKIGRKPIIMGGCLIAALTYFTVFPMLQAYANPALVAAQKAMAVSITADPAQCSFQGSPIARPIDFTSSCDIAKRTLTENYIPYKNVDAPAGTVATIKIGDKDIENQTDVLRSVAGTAPGKKLEVVVMRKGKEKKLTVELMEKPKAPEKTDTEPEK